MADRKWCQAGKHFVDRKEFNKDSTRRDGRFPYCRECMQTFRQPYGEKDYARFIQRQYGIPFEQYQQMLEEQENRCAICRIHEDDLSRRLNVDHCHDSGVVRALLCLRCNTGLGHFRDSADLLEEAVAYLKDFGVLKAEAI